MIEEEEPIERRPEWEGWALLEIFGHRKIAGRLSQADLCGRAFLRIQIPRPDGKEISQFYSPQAIYGITPTTEEVARAFAAHNRTASEPVTRYELPPLPPPRAPVEATATEDDGLDHQEDDF